MSHYRYLSIAAASIGKHLLARSALLDTGVIAHFLQLLHNLIHIPPPIHDNNLHKQYQYFRNTQTNDHNLHLIVDVAHANMPPCNRTHYYDINNFYYNVK